MPAPRCRRCGEALSDSERYCMRCGLDQRPDRRGVGVGATRARKREEEWLRQPRDLARITEADATPDAPVAPAEGPSADHEPPLDELVYWALSVRMLGDLQGLATAQVERLRARCISSGMPAAEVDRRVEAALPDLHGTETVAPAGWYPDPAGSLARRFWTGATWTHKVR